MLTLRGNTVSLTNLPVSFVVPPFSFVDRTASVVKGSPSVPLTLSKISCVLIALGIMGLIRSLQDPDVCASSMLAEKRAYMIHNKNWNE